MGHESVDAKRSKIASDSTGGASTNGDHEPAVIVDDSADGAIVIDNRATSDPSVIVAATVAVS